MAFGLKLKSNQTKILSGPPYSVMCEITVLTQSFINLLHQPSIHLSSFFSLSPHSLQDFWSLSSEVLLVLLVFLINSSEVTFFQSCSQSVFAISVLQFIRLLSSPENELVIHGSICQRVIHGSNSCEFPSSVGLLSPTLATFMSSARFFFLRLFYQLHFNSKSQA